MDFLNDINDYLSRLTTVTSLVDKTKIDFFAKLLIDIYEKEKQIFIFGNGGSGSTASHVVCDFNKGVSLELKKKFKFISLSDNIASMLAYSNDISYDEIFEKQLANYLNKGDLVIGVSGSGNSINVIKALQFALNNEALVFGLCGYDGGKIKSLCNDNCLHIPINDMQIVEDFHVIVFHMLMQILYKHLSSMYK